MMTEQIPKRTRTGHDPPVLEGTEIQNRPTGGESDQENAEPLVQRLVREGGDGIGQRTKGKSAREFAGRGSDGRMNWTVWLFGFPCGFLHGHRRRGGRGKPLGSRAGLAATGAALANRLQFNRVRGQRRDALREQEDQSEEDVERGAHLKTA